MRGANMATQATSMFMSKKDKERYDSWTKEQVYEAYLSEREARVKLNIEVNATNRLVAEIKFMASR